MSLWINQLKIKAPIRRAIIIHGNIYDILWDAGKMEYDTVPSAVYKVLKEIGYDEIIVWDRLQGGRSIIDKENYSRICAQVCEESMPGQNNKDVQAYDIGEKTDINNFDASNVVGNDPAKYFSLIEKRLQSPRVDQSVAFIIDWSDSLFGNANNLSEQERVWLMQLGKSIREAPCNLSADSLDKPQDIFILLTGKLGSIPPRFYQTTTAVTDLYVPLPSRKDRSAFVKETLSRWRLRKPLQVGTREFEEFIDSLDGFSLRDLQQLLKLSRFLKEKLLTSKELVTLYKYGEMSSPWEDLSRNRLMELEDYLGESVKGQDHALKKVRSVIIRAFSGLSGLQHSSRQQTPKGILFFVGPTGVGKTELAKALARFLFGDEEACIRFDMSEFNHEHSDQRLVGAPPGYVGYEEGGQLTNEVKQRPFSVLLFDEIEKAHSRILDKFLQILEDGRLTDGKGETVSFSETIIIFTSNIGTAMDVPGGSEKEVHKFFIEQVKRHFKENLHRPELLNRIGDNIVPFNFLKDNSVLAAIVKAKIKPLKERLKEKYRIEDNIIDDNEAFIDVLISNFDTQTGGRGVLNMMASRLIDPLSEFLFSEDNQENYAGKSLSIKRIGNTARFHFRLQ